MARERERGGRERMGGGGGAEEPEAPRFSPSIARWRQRSPQL